MIYRVPEILALGQRKRGRPAKTAGIAPDDGPGPTLRKVGRPRKVAAGLEGDLSAVESAINNIVLQRVLGLIAKIRTALDEAEKGLQRTPFPAPFGAKTASELHRRLQGRAGTEGDCLQARLRRACLSSPGNALPAEASSRHGHLPPALYTPSPVCITGLLPLLPPSRSARIFLGDDEHGWLSLLA